MSEEDSLILIHCDDDGDKRFEVVSKGEFLRRLKEHEYGEEPVFAKPGEKIDLDYFVGLIVIKGRIVQPKAVKVATEYHV